MTAFRFRLQRVLLWYEKRSKIEEDRLRVIVTDLSRIDSDKENVRQSRQETERGIIESASLDAADLSALAGFVEGTRRELVALAQKRSQLEAMLLEQRARVNVLRTKMRLLEKLRDRRVSEYRVEEERELEELAADAYRAASFRQGLESERSQP
jgi:hypothetical protein